MINRGQLSLNQFITELAHTEPRQAQAWQRMTDYINNLATNAANTGGDEITPPPPIAGLNVKASSTGELVHVAHDHPGALQRGVQYFTEVGVNDSSFSRPMVIDHGASRTEHPFMLPTNDDNGVKIKYYFRSYAQYHGSKRSDYAYWGTQGNPTPVTMNGATNMTPLASFGSGTAPNSGAQAGQGLGNFLVRPATQAAKRVIGS